MEKFRIKEVVLNKDGTNIWFYPEVCVTHKQSEGVLFWKKTLTIEEWQRFYSGRYGITHMNEGALSVIEGYDNIIGFREFSEANDWIEKYKQKELNKSIEINEKWLKYVGSKMNANKIHEVK